MSLNSHLASGVTTVCYCWIIRRKDGRVLGFTDHDATVTVGGVECSATTGMTTTQFEQTLGLSDDNLEIEGIIDDVVITADDIRGGLYDAADVELYVVNWANNSDYDKVAAGTFGTMIETDEGSFSVEFRSMGHYLGLPIGRTYQRTCDTKVGSITCGVDLTHADFKTDTTIASIEGVKVTLSSLAGYDDDWFSFGKMVLASGQECAVRFHEGNVLYLWRTPDVKLVVGDAVTVTAGCVQDTNTCQSKFSNIANFQGFPLMPGLNRITEYPVRGASDYTGGSLFVKDI